MLYTFYYLLSPGQSGHLFITFKWFGRGCAIAFEFGRISVLVHYFTCVDELLNFYAHVSLVIQSNVLNTQRELTIN